MLIDRKCGKTKGPRIDLSKAPGPKISSLGGLGRNHGQSGSPQRHNEWGAAKLGAIFGLGLVVLGGLGYLMLGQGGRRQPQEVQGPQTTKSLGTELAPTQNGERRADFSNTPSGMAEVPNDLSLIGGGPRTEALADRFQGLGVLRGTVAMSDGSPMPRRWTLRASPSKTLMGGEFAEKRLLEFTAGEVDFRLDELPFGSYDIRAQSASSNARSMQVILDRKRSNIYLSIQMEPAGELDGRILDHEGNPAAGVPIVLLKLPGLERWRRVSDELGRYRFEQVLDSAYQLVLGEYENPIMPRTKPLRLQAPGMTYPDIELPKLATLDLRVVNELGENLGGVIVRGAGDHGGSVDAKTDIFGTLRVMHLPAGRYRLRFQSEGYRVRRSPVDLQIDRENAFAVELLLE